MMLRLSGLQLPWTLPSHPADPGEGSRDLSWLSCGGRGVRFLSIGIFAALVCLFLFPASVGAQEGADEIAEAPENEETGRRGAKQDEGFFGLTPFFNSGPYTTIQRVKGNVATTFGPSDTPRNTLTNMGWLFELGVSSPTLEALPGDPRLNVFAGVLIPTNESSVIGSRIAVTAFGEDVVTEGTKMQLEYQTSYRAGVGLEFPLQVLGVDLRLMPGAQYLLLGSRYAAQVGSTRVFGDFTIPNETRNSAAKNAFNQHLFGPSLKITTESVDIGAFRFDLYIEGSLLFDVAGTREQSRFVDSDGEISVFTWEASTTAGVFNAGFRILLP